jgi:methyl-accepting chemotaxis protein
LNDAGKPSSIFNTFNFYGVIMSRTANEIATNSTNPLLFYVLPSGLGAAGGLLSAVLGGFTVVSVGCTIVLAAVGFFIGSSLLSQQQRYQEKLNQHWREEGLRKLQDSQAYSLELERLILQASPALLRHVQQSRLLSEQEIHDLSQQFSALANQIEHVGHSTHMSANGRSVEQLFSESRSALKTVLGALGEIQDVENAVVEQVRKLSTHTQQLDSMAQEVRKVAEQINLLALNAAIEAARAGENGRGFAVVADEVRKLAGFSSSTGEKISHAIEEINAAMTSTLKMSEASGTSDDKAIHDAEQAITLALDDLQAAMDLSQNDATLLRHNSDTLRSEITTAMRAFRFQERVSEQLMQVENSLNGLQQELDNIQASGSRQANSLEVSKLLARLNLH